MPLAAASLKGRVRREEGGREGVSASAHRQELLVGLLLPKCVTGVDLVPVLESILDKALRFAGKGVGWGIGIV